MIHVLLRTACFNFSSSLLFFEAKPVESRHGVFQRLNG